MQTKLRIFSVGLIALVACAAIFGAAPLTAFAMEESADVAESADSVVDYENAEPLALYVSVVVSIDGADGQVWSIAQTKISIFASTIYVVLELYSSDTYQDSYTSMTLEKRVSSSNLKKGESIKAIMPTNGAQKYWRGRMYFKADSGNWKYAETNTWLFDANGIVVL